MATGLDDKAGVCALSNTAAHISYVFIGHHNLATVIFDLGDNDKVFEYRNGGNPPVIWFYIRIKFGGGTITCLTNPLKPKDEDDMDEAQRCMR